MANSLATTGDDEADFLLVLKVLGVFIGGLAQAFGERQLRRAVQWLSSGPEAEIVWGNIRKSVADRDAGLFHVNSIADIGKS